ncbi:MAG TPA: PA2928 family protein [Caldimonas sp.]|nr:PA2928 family protein [Caldimonas sp.]HEX2539721.1 PA2928 family protein [Caldimonas sp.]
MKKGLKALVVGIVALAGTAALVLLAMRYLVTATFDPPQRAGPPALVMPDGDPQVWLVTTQEERRVVGGMDGVATETLQHVELRSFDSRTARPLWKRRMLTLADERGRVAPRARILGQDGNVVWLFIADQPVAVAALDGEVRATRSHLEEKNPALRGLLPDKLDFYAFDAGLVITAADARRHLVGGTDWLARDYRPASDDHFRRITFNATQWNGGWRTADFTTRHGTVLGRWLGLHSDAEAADAGDDGFGDKIKDPTRVRTESSPVRRALRQARIGRTKVFSEGSHPRLFDVAAIPGRADYLDAGFLVAAGTRLPLELASPRGVVVVHRTRADAQGRMAMTRLDERLNSAWTATLPFAEIANRWQMPDRLILYGPVPDTDARPGRQHEGIAVLGLDSGAWRGWNVGLEQEIAAAPR